MFKLLVSRAFMGLGILLVVYLVWLGITRFGSGPFAEDRLTGLLVFEDFNRCGLARTRGKDFWSCEISSEYCSRLRERTHSRVEFRVRALPDCSGYSGLRCSKSAEFNEAGFRPEKCFATPGTVNFSESD